MIYIPTRNKIHWKERKREEAGITALTHPLLAKSQSLFKKSKQANLSKEFKITFCYINVGVGFSQRFFSIICKTFLTIFQLLFFQAHPSSTGSRPHRRLCEPRQCVFLFLTAQFLFLVWPVSQSNISFHVADNNLLCSEFTCSAEFKQLPKSRQNTPAFVCYHKLTLEFNWPPRVLLCAFSVYNFSHRIDHLSFGEEVPGIISPLDGTEKITFNSESRLFSHVRAEGRAPRRGIDSDNIISTEFDPFNFSFNFCCR